MIRGLSPVTDSLMSTRLTIVEPSLHEALVAAGFTNYRAFVGSAQGEVVHESGTTRTRRIVLNQASRADSFYLKVYRRGGRTWPARDKARREAMNYAVLRDRCDVRVPEVIAFGSRRRFGRLMDGFILTRAVPKGLSLDRLAAALWPTPPATPTDGLRRHLLKYTAAMVRRMHAAGYCHIDLQWRNLLVCDDGSDTPDVYAIDSSRGGLRQWAVRREQGRLRDLSSLYKEARHRLTMREQLRWLREYLGVKRFEPQHRALLQTIQYDRAIKDHEASG